METLLIVAQWILPLLYLALVIDYGTTFALRIRTHVRNRWVPVVILCHAAFLLARGLHLGYPPLFSACEILTFIALSIAVVYYVVELVERDRRSGVFVFFLAFLSQYASSIVLAYANTEDVVREGHSHIHSVAAIFAYTALALAAIYGALYLVGRRNLKQHHLGLLFDRLPPLELLGRASRYGIIVGFIFMTFSLATGVLIFGRADPSTHAEMLSWKVISNIVLGTVAWLICGVAVFGKVVRKWSDARISLIAILGFAAAMVLLVAGSIL